MDLPEGRSWQLERVDATLEATSFGSTDPNAPVLVFVHGFPDDPAVFAPVIGALGDQVRSVVYGTRGCASTPVKDRRASYRLPVLADDLLAVIASIPGSPRVHLVGHDWGSVQGWEAVARPDAPARIATFTSISGPSLDHLRQLSRRSALRPSRWPFVGAQLARSWYAVSFGLGPLRPVALRVYLRRGRRDFVGRDVRRDARRGVRLYQANILARMLRGRPPHSGVPVRVIRPVRDRFLAQIVYADLDEWIQHLEVVAVDGGHWWIHDRPAEAAEVLLAGITTDPRRSR